MTHSTTSKGRQPTVGLSLSHSAALLTPIGEGGISLVELDGPDVGHILAPLFHSPRGLTPSAALPGRLLYGKLVDEGELLDEVLLEITSPTRCIINCHGGYIAASRILASLEARGVHRIEPKSIWDVREANGELDTLQCEAAQAMPHALTLRAAALLLDQYHGALSGAIGEALALIERGESDKAAESLRCLLDTAPYGRGLMTPPTIVVAGRPNVGKSTLMNALLRYDRVIVHPTAGTTRDAVEDIAAINGIPLKLIDTAGIRQTPNAIEREGVARGINALSHADLALLIFDGSQPLASEDTIVLSEPLPGKVLLIINKADLPSRLDMNQLATHDHGTPIPLSAETGDGLETLETRILDLLYPNMPEEGAAAIFTERQQALVVSALEAIEEGTFHNCRISLSELMQAGKA
jgi:tRNA modification GTPase